MNVQITHVIVHTPEQVREIVREAQTLAGEETSDAVARESVFREACRLLGQRYTFAAAPQAVPMPPMALPGLRGGN
jgi:hypothetical protein